jgi:hypothetical protein
MVFRHREGEGCGGVVGALSGNTLAVDAGSSTEVKLVVKSCSSHRDLRSSEVGLGLMDSV